MEMNEKENSLKDFGDFYIKQTTEKIILIC